jgi:hypothetical protein
MDGKMCEFISVKNLSEKYPNETSVGIIGIEEYV